MKISPAHIVHQRLIAANERPLDDHVERQGCRVVIEIVLTIETAVAETGPTSITGRLGLRMSRFDF